MAHVFDAVAVAEARAEETKTKVPALLANPTPSTAIPLPSLNSGRTPRRRITTWDSSFKHSKAAGNFS